MACSLSQELFHVLLDEAQVVMGRLNREAPDLMSHLQFDKSENAKCKCSDILYSHLK